MIHAGDADGVIAMRIMTTMMMMMSMMSLLPMKLEERELY